MSNFSKTDFFESFIPKTEPVKIGEHTIYVREVSALARGKFESANEEADFNATIRPRWVAMTACDEQGDLLFDDGDIEAIGQMPLSIVNAIFDAALRINGLGKEAQKSLGNGSETTQSDA